MVITFRLSIMSTITTTTTTSLPDSLKADVNGILSWRSYIFHLLMGYQTSLPYFFELAVCEEGAKQRPGHPEGAQVFIRNYEKRCSKQSHMRCDLPGLRMRAPALMGDALDGNQL